METCDGDEGKDERQKQLRGSGGMSLPHGDPFIVFRTQNP